MVRHAVSLFDLSQTLLVGGGLLVLCFLPGPPVIKQLIQMVTMVPGQGEQFSQCVPSNNIKTEGKKEQENKSEELNPLPCSLSLSLFSCVYVFVCLCFGLMVNRNR